MMTYSKTGLAITEKFEGCKLSAYQDSVGVWTIGYGHTLGVQEGDTCTQEQAEQWLQEDTDAAVSNVNQHLTVQVSQNEFDALVDFAFNLGVGNFDGSTLLKDVNSGDLEAAAQEFEKWDHAGGKVVAGLLRRRLAEETEFEDGQVT
jgi:lysozyme